ncbi:MAG: hypothetical protein WCO00_02085 [Rhodospirillaceae bacterium]
MISWNLPALALALVVWGGAEPALAVSASATPTLVVAEATGDGAARDAAVAPLPDNALPGAYCLGAATAAMAAVYAAGPSESLMLLSGAMHVPSGSAVLFIPLLSILGGGSCALAAAAQPAVSWAIEQSDNIAAQVAATGESWFAPRSDLMYASAGADDMAKDSAVVTVRAMTEGETQSMGCVAGALAGFGGAMATSPGEVAMLSSGATTIVSSTPILALGLLGTIVVSGCGIGTFAILPIQAFFNNFTAIGDSLLGGLNQTGTMVGEAASRLFAALRGGAAIEIADGVAAR